MNDQLSSTPRIDKHIFFTAVAFVLLMCIMFFGWPEESFALLNQFKVWIENQFGIMYIWLGNAALIFVLWLALGKYGPTKLGINAPKFSTYSWAAMLFSAGVATGIIYWGAIEWAYYVDLPPFGIEAGSTEALEWAATYGIFHWGIHGWTFYVLPGVGIGYMYYVKGIPNLGLRTACKPLLGDKAEGWLGKSIDIFFVIAMLGSSATSLGLGVPMVSEGISQLFNIPNTFALKSIFIVILSLIFGASVYLGLEKGIKPLSNWNSYLGFAFLAFVLLAGPTMFIFKMSTNSVGLLLQNFIRMSTWTEPLTNTRFVEDWTIFYWAWWVAVGPFMGVFIAKISEGRSIRQMILGTLIFGTLGSMLFFDILGNYGMHQELQGNIAVLDMVRANQTPQAIIAIVKSLPLGTIVLVFFTILCTGFMATSFDSTSYIIASTTTRALRPEQEPQRWNRLFWAFALVLLPMGLMLVGGLNALKLMVLVSAFPMIVVYVLLMLAIVKMLRE